MFFKMNIAAVFAPRRLASCFYANLSKYFYLLKSSYLLQGLDDEKMLWEVLGSLLKRLDYDVDFAINGQQAISLYRQAFEKGSDYALLILDLTIRGGPGGKEVLQKILKINPEAKAVVLSGYNTDPVFLDHQKYGFVGALQKPFRIEEFMHLMNSVLEREK